ncbi:3-hydroxy-3-methylglutaryl-coenzyme A (HMG-CoA) reductase isozyme [Cadophora gregata]|uniref:3-hydroxy-3-methylglutaryl-coenzyme A (HMG-CoA) reductase isozyme n=1 Tax=Cadophora gregata TaxID=51156 RepID=UPI0026DB1E08|nr:3-hydroxy-3-methylglutaryl-coenzyme A (HMG-CoA) reductase isozyme [Cadophora gregata]KAK0118133.1 3-hydroxy-3-methylglutaryl-coenzyme A (HMG-CoA) reductase isozyme [Cadophora gregata]KAK0123205.1 3-hydroxy-3-methylglutaryl-coenzyme A (HMG-CoA) reductase isozyme [Cadophora gregata f. sp. sojae]
MVRSLLGTFFVPTRARGASTTEAPATPVWVNKKVTPLLQTLSRRACLHPIHTIVIVAVLASTTYIGLLEGSLFETATTLGKADWTSLNEGSRQLRVGAETGWKWQTSETEAPVSKDVDHLALLTFVFPDSLAASSPQNAPLSHTIPLPQNLSVTELPSTSNPLSAISQDTSLAYSVPYDQAAEFLASAQELPNAITSPKDESARHGQEAEAIKEQKMWIMKAAKSSTTNNSVKNWASNAWTEFVDLIKNAETLDIIIMVLGYISMHLTFVSLFVSMRRMGSNFWLFATTLFSSVFAFLFGLIVTTKMGVPLNMVLLSEGLPFLVVTIGFEKAIVLTKAVLSASLETRRPQPQGSPKLAGADQKFGVSPTSIQYAVQVAINEKGYEIVRDYVIEICILVAGAASGVQGGLQQFCFLAAWILVFDCILLFTFYTAILSIKLEINRIKRHVALRQALEDDGVNHRIAENVAESDEWPKADKSGNNETNIFGRKVRDSSVPKFKVLMVSGFVIVNILNLCTIPFRGGKSNAEAPSVTGLSGQGFANVMTQPPMDPFKVASNGLDAIFEMSKSNDKSTVVTVLTPIKYELEYPSVHYGNMAPRDPVDIQNADDSEYGRVVDSLLKSLEDPILSKWIVFALALSVILNGYLFNAARWSIKEPIQMPPHHAVDPAELHRAERFNDAATAQPPRLPAIGNGAADAILPLTPATTDDEEDGLTMRRRQPEPVTDSQPALRRTQAEMEQMLKEKRARELTDRELVELSLQGKIAGYALEKTLGDTTRAVKIRRSIISRTPATAETTSLLESSLLPYEHYDFDRVLGACCENVVGYLPLPLGVAGPIVIDGQSFFVPMATTEGVLVASTSRGSKAINAGGGATTVLIGDGMTRGPCVSFESLARAGAAKVWLDSKAGQKIMTDAFNSTSRFARLQSIKTALAGTYLYPRFKTTTGDAMGMNMISKGVEHALSVMATEAGFDDMEIISVSGNMCTDKKAAAINWIDGRGKSVVAEAIIPGDVVRKVLKSDVDELVELNIAKNLVGSALAGAMGGFNAHAANIVAAIFLATGQDPAQVVESANCITLMKNLNGDLQISVSMPSIEVGTLGGGTILEPQAAMLDMLGVRGSHPTNPGDNARKLARIIAAAVLAGELSLCSALRAGHLVKSHMAHNRSAPVTRSNTPAPAGVQTPVTSAIASMQERAGLAMSPAATQRAAEVRK